MNSVLEQARERVEEAFGHKFSDASLLDMALTHPSWGNEHENTPDNQRLEFLGDAVLGFLLADRVFSRFNGKPEGVLTNLRSAVSSGAALAAKALEIGLGDALRLGAGELKNGGAKRPKNLEDAMEAVFGAVYLDGGLEAARTAMDRLFAKELESLSSLREWDGNPRGRLQALTQERFGCAPEYGAVAMSGPCHNPVFETSVSANGKTARGKGHSKHAAQTAAAQALLEVLDGDA